MRSKKITNKILVAIATIMTTLPVPVVHAQSASAGFAGINICKPGRIDIPLELQGSAAGEQSGLPIHLEADKLETESLAPNKNGVLKLFGKAHIVQGKRGVYADQITYAQDTEQANANGNVRLYTSRGDEVLADSLELEMPAFIGRARNARIKFAEESEETAADIAYVRARASADSIEFAGGDYQRLHNATFSSCEQGNDDVLLVAKEIELDHAAGIGTAKSMKVKFKNVPIFYFPQVSFPINNQRKSGFLFPNVGYDKESGAILEAPYYLNLAPHHDATVTPRVLSKRGVQLYGEYRYLTQKSEGNVQAEVLPSDDVFNDDRYAWHYRHQQNFNARWNMDVDLQSVSDRNYLRDFTSDVGVVSASLIPQQANLFYHSPNIFFKASASAYEPANSSVSDAERPYDRLPLLNLNIKSPRRGLFQYGINYELAHFDRDESEDNVNSATRLRIKPYVSMPIKRSYGYVTPKLALQSISYSLDNNATEQTSPSVTVPVTSIDSGLFFERQFVRNDSRFLQTLEPRLLYLNIPENRKQNTFPNFDSGNGSESSFGHLFRENRFFGGDRIGDTHQIAVALTSRIINRNDARQRLKLSVGQIFFLEDRQVRLPDETMPATKQRSDFFTEASTSVTEHWDIRGFVRMNSESNDLEFAQISTQYSDNSRKDLSIGYSRVRDSSEQVNLKFQTPIGNQWQINAKARYSIRENETRSSEIGLTYDGCCWATGLFAQHYLDGTGHFKNRFIITFELNDLGRIRSNF